LRVARAFALASTFVVSLSFPSALQAFHTFRALERNIDLIARFLRMLFVQLRIACPAMTALAA
jgi:hypothetical protein